MPTFARISTRVTAVAAALVAGIAIAPAASAQSSKESLDLSGLFTDTVVTGTLKLDGDAGKLVNLSAISRGGRDPRRVPRRAAAVRGRGVRDRPDV